MGEENVLQKANSAVSLTKNTRPSSALRQNLFLVKPLADNKNFKSETEPKVESTHDQNLDNQETTVKDKEDDTRKQKWQLIEKLTNIWN